MSTENQQSAGTRTTEVASDDHEHLVELVESQLETSPAAYAAVEDEDHAFVVAAWRADGAVVRSVRFGCRLRDDTVTQIGTRTTHHVDEAVETATWSRQFLHGRKERALKVARAQIDWEERDPSRPFDGPFFGTF